jgi:hypothetical protein
MNKVMDPFTHICFVNIVIRCSKYIVPMFDLYIPIVWFKLWYK